MQPIKTLQDIIDLKKLYKDLKLSSVTVSKSIFDNLIKEEKKRKEKFCETWIDYNDSFESDYAIAKFSSKPIIENISEKFIETSDEDFEKSWKMVVKDREKGMNAY